MAFGHVAPNTYKNFQNLLILTMHIKKRTAHRQIFQASIHETQTLLAVDIVFIPITRSLDPIDLDVRITPDP